MGFNKNEPRDERGRWTEGGGSHLGGASGHNAGVGRSAVARHIAAVHESASGGILKRLLTKIGLIEDKAAYDAAVAAGKTPYRRGDGVLRIHENKPKKPKDVFKARQW